MVRRSAMKPPGQRRPSARRCAGASVASALLLGFAALPAEAEPASGALVEPGPTGGTNGGNGRHNRNTFSVRSPTRNSGYQHTNNGNAGGANSVQNALCRRARVCNVTQVTIIRPGPAASPAPAAPAADPFVPVTDPFFYLGAYGLMLTVPESAPAAPPAASEAPPVVTYVRRSRHSTSSRHSLE